MVLASNKIIVSHSAQVQVYLGKINSLYLGHQVSYYS